MSMKSATIDGNAEDARLLSEMDQCLAEINEIRRDMKKMDVEIKRLGISTRRKLAEIRANLHVQKAA